MTVLIRLLGGALALFLLLGGIQEWRTLGKGLFLSDEAPPPVSDSDRDAAARTVVNFAQLSSHYYGSGGDRRFAERLPASAALIEEMRRDTAYVAHNGRIQEPALVRIEVLSVTASDSDRVEVRTREFWTTNWILRADGLRDATRSDVVNGRYRLIREGASWQIVEWDPEEKR